MNCVREIPRSWSDAARVRDVDSQMTSTFVLKEFANVLNLLNCWVTKHFCNCLESKALKGLNNGSWTNENDETDVEFHQITLRLQSCLFFYLKVAGTLLLRPRSRAGQAYLRANVCPPLHYTMQQNDQSVGINVPTLSYDWNKFRLSNFQFDSQRLILFLIQARSMTSEH